MAKFVLLYTGGHMGETEEDNAQIMAAWGAWYGQMGENIMDGGNPFSTAKYVSSDGVSDGAGTSPAVTGYTIIAADSIDDAVTAVNGHPHIKYGGQVNVHEAFDM